MKSVVQEALQLFLCIQGPAVPGGTGECRTDRRSGVAGQSLCRHGRPRSPCRTRPRQIDYAKNLVLVLYTMQASFCVKYADTLYLFHFLSDEVVYPVLPLEKEDRFFGADAPDTAATDQRVDTDLS